MPLVGLDGVHNHFRTFCQLGEKESVEQLQRLLQVISPAFFVDLRPSSAYRFGAVSLDSPNAHAEFGGMFGDDCVWTPKWLGLLGRLAPPIPDRSAHADRFPGFGLLSHSCDICHLDGITKSPLSAREARVAMPTLTAYSTSARN
jgi:hypothetical protein